MEANIIVAGFKALESMLGLHYTEVIQNSVISMLRTVHSTIWDISNKSRVCQPCCQVLSWQTGAIGKGPKDIAASVNHSSQTITYDTRCAMRKHYSTNDVVKLKQDLRAGPRHFLENHKICDPA